MIGNEYNTNSIIIYQYNNLNGNGREYDDYGELKFVGEYLNGRKNGKGKEYYNYG